LLTEQAKCTSLLLEDFSEKEYRRAIELKTKIFTLGDNYEKVHIERVKEKECLPTNGIFYLEIIAEIRKLSRHLENISDRSRLISQKAKASKQ
jgi:Na+/phosphate symporter